MKLPRLNHKGFTVVEIVLGLAVIVALIGGGTLIYKRVRPGNPFKANASTYAFVNDVSKMVYQGGSSVTSQQQKVDGVTYATLNPGGSRQVVQTVVSASQLTNATKVCAHFRSFNTPNNYINIQQIGTDNKGKNYGSFYIAGTGTGNVCTQGVYKGSGLVSVYMSNGNGSVGIDTIYATL